MQRTFYATYRMASWIAMLLVDTRFFRRRRIMNHSALSWWWARWLVQTSITHSGGKLSRFEQWTVLVWSLVGGDQYSDALLQNAANI